jgi:glycosyltransferase involved in cell wall biosynthesis
MNIHLYPSVLKNESRILKIVRSLCSHALFDEISVIGRSGEGLPAHEDLGNGIHLYRLSPLFGEDLNNTFGKIFRTLGWYLAVLFWMRNRTIDCLNCHSLPVLPLSVLLKTWKRCKLVYDTHELETETHVSRGLRKSLAKIVEGVLIRKVDAVCVVNRSIAIWYKESYGLSRVWVVHNMPPRMKSQPKRTGLLRNAIGLRSPTSLLFIYQGLLSPGRGIEMILDVFAGIRGDTHLVCMGYGPLEETVHNAVKLYDNIHFMPAVAPDLVQNYTVDADVGIALSENTCLSYYLSAPNKLFEYAACGVAALVSDVPEMSRFVDAYEWGWKVNLEVRDFRCLVESIDAESLKIKRFNATRAGAEYCWENEEPELLMMYENLGFNQLSTSPT